MRKSIILAVALMFCGTVEAQYWNYQTQPSYGQQYLNQLNQQRQTNALESLSRDFRSYQQQQQMNRMLNRNRVSPYSTQGYRPYQFNY